MHSDFPVPPQVIKPELKSKKQKALAQELQFFEPKSQNASEVIPAALHHDGCHDSRGDFDSCRSRSEAKLDTKLYCDSSIHLPLPRRSVDLHRCPVLYQLRGVGPTQAPTRGQRKAQRGQHWASQILLNSSNEVVFRWFQKSTKSHWFANFFFANLLAICRRSYEAAERALQDGDEGGFEFQNMLASEITEAWIAWHIACIACSSCMACHGHGLC